MDDLNSRISQLQAAYDQAAGQLKLPADAEQLRELEKRMAAPDFWQAKDQAQATAKEHANLSKKLKPWRDFKAAADELAELAKIGDGSLAAEISAQLASLESRLDGLRRQLRFSGPHDGNDVILSVFAGAGGTDAQDWAAMLLRMYQRWADKNGVSHQTLDVSPGEEAGLKSAIIKLSGGGFLYGRLKGEHGVHRLVRLSPYNADQKRQTSFAKVDILPLIDQPDELRIDDKDLKIDVFRSGGAGGQSVNTTDSAVRVTHLPTGIAVTIQNERSQLQNKETALSVLRSRLAGLQQEQHAQTLADLKGPNQSAEWGNQIRSYVLHPYKQVKDARSGYESSDVQAVLDGELEPLIEAWLAAAGQA